MMRVSLFLKRFEEWSVLIGLLIVSLLAFANVVSRYVLNLSFAFTSELTVNLAVYVIIVGSVIALREGGHLGFGLLADQASEVTRRRLEMFVYCAIGVFYLILTLTSFDLANRQFERGTSSPSLGVPDFLYTSALVIGGGLGVVRSIQLLINQLPQPVETLSGEGLDD